MLTARAHNPKPRSSLSSAAVPLLRPLAVVDFERDAAPSELTDALSLLERSDSTRCPANDDGGPQGLSPWRAHRVKAHIEAHLASTITLQDVADLCRLSRGYCSRAFKATFGRTFSAYLVQARVEAAQRMLLTTATSICEIAALCGFADQSHLCRLFRRAVGMPPHAWRKRFAESAAVVAAAPLSSVTPSANRRLPQ